MSVDPQCQAILDDAAPFDGDYTDARAGYAAVTADYRHDNSELAGIEDRTFEGPGGKVPVRIYRPQAKIVTVEDPIEGAATAEQTPGKAALAGPPAGSGAGCGVSASTAPGCARHWPPEGAGKTLVAYGKRGPESRIQIRCGR